jgi:hypothetical protein
MELARVLAKYQTMFFISKGGEAYFPAFQFGPDGAKPVQRRVDAQREALKLEATSRVRHGHLNWSAI